MSIKQSTKLHLSDAEVDISADQFQWDADLGILTVPFSIENLSFGFDMWWQVSVHEGAEPPSVGIDWSDGETFIEEGETLNFSPDLDVSDYIAPGQERDVWVMINVVERDVGQVDYEQYHGITLERIGEESVPITDCRLTNRVIEPGGDETVSFTILNERSGTRNYSWRVESNGVTVATGSENVSGTHDVEVAITFPVEGEFEIVVHGEETNPPIGEEPIAGDCFAGTLLVGEGIAPGGPPSGLKIAAGAAGLAGIVWYALGRS